ncbi:MAG: CRISPR-associated endonuclease Cas2 [Opitutales bacterium]|nr:CRISPR-associated endonuclease Cas2 [Opitutales bacterium]
MTFYIVSYDIPSGKDGDSRRAKLAKYLCGIGLRVQMSVFELRLQPEKLLSVCRDMEEIINADTDTIRIYSICSNCEKKSVFMGKKAPCEYESAIFF